MTMAEGNTYTLNSCNTKVLVNASNQSRVSFSADTSEDAPDGDQQSGSQSYGGNHRRSRVAQGEHVHATSARSQELTAAEDKGHIDEDETLAVPSKRARRQSLDLLFPDEDQTKAEALNEYAGAPSATRVAFADLDPNLDAPGAALPMGSKTPEMIAADRAVDAAEARLEAAEAEVVRMRGEVNRVDRNNVPQILAASKACKPAEARRDQAKVAFWAAWDRQQQLQGHATAASASSAAPSASADPGPSSHHGAASFGARDDVSVLAAATSGDDTALSHGASVGAGVAGQGDVSSPASAPPSTAVEPRPLPNHPQAQDVQTGDDVASHPTPTLEKSAATPVVGPPLNPPSELPVKTHAAVQTVNEPPQNPPAVKTSGKRKSLALLTKQAANPAPVSTKPGGKTSYVVSESGGLAWEIQTEPPGFAGEPKLDGDRSNTAKGIETGPGKNPEEMTSAEEPAKEGQKDGQAGGGKRSDVGRKRRWSASLAPVLEELEEGEIRPEAQEEQEFGEGHTARLTAAAGAMQTEITVAGNYVAQEPDVRSPSNATTPGNETRPGACEFGVDFPPAAGPPIPFAEAMQRLMTLIGSCGKQVDLLGELTAIIGGSPEISPELDMGDEQGVHVDAVLAAEKATSANVEVQHDAKHDQSPAVFSPNQHAAGSKTYDEKRIIRTQRQLSITSDLGASNELPPPGDEYWQLSLRDIPPSNNETSGGPAPKVAPDTAAIKVSIGGKHDQEEDVRNLSATILSDKPSGSFDAGVEFPSAAVAHSAFDETKQHQKIHSDYNNGQIESRPIALEKGTPQGTGGRFQTEGAPVPAEAYFDGAPVIDINECEEDDMLIDLSGAHNKVNDQLDASPLKPLALPPRATFTTNGKSRPGSTAGSFRTDNQTTGAIGSTDGSNGAARAEERVLEEARLRAAADNARAPIMGADGNEHVAQGEGIQNQGEGREDWDPEEFGYNVHHNPEFGESGGDVN